MKNLIGFLAILIAFFASCSDQEGIPKGDRPTGGINIDVRAKIVIVDSELQDRLNPESPGYFGDAYTEGIELFHLYKGNKITALDAYFVLGGEKIMSIDNYEDYFRTPIRSNIRLFYDSSTDTEMRINENTLGYYYILADPIPVFAENDFMYEYIRYPDGSEDEIKFQLYRGEKGTSLLYDKIWINGELAYEREYNYNPTFYPFLEPLLDDDGNQIRDYVHPKHGTDIIVITK